ncbi:myc box-dependent-interacting protein 1b isoform X1 [Nerophis lumbriciformis]|uniref:myc box-dependent-interacting protein 1b isoform X1 n=1 Tax=Nerophis lumbriciformis TaxID=546530 RepID=UPI002ADF5336|nr:myc box-dependent-interacting protein 1-like isoform X1 [Nerophis lumbriciformis]
MAEAGKGVTAGKLAVTVQKRLSRAQEKVMQKLGKADETKDVVFEEMVANFNKQMGEGTKLQRDLKAYLAAVKTMHETSRRLQDCLADMYEPEWFGKEEMDAVVEEMIEKEMDNNLEDTDTMWLDFHQNITDSSVPSMDSYLTQFPEIKARIAKRDRKMVDFDSARHHFSSLQKGKKKDEAKIAKPAALLEMAAPSWAQGLLSAHQVAQTNLSYNQAEEELGRAQKIFEELNVELQDQLPVLWDSRVGVYVNTFQSLAGHQERFHKEMSKLSQNLNDIMTKLEEQRQLKNDGTTATKTIATAKSEEANHSQAATSPTRPGPPPSRPPPSLRPQHDQLLDEDTADVNTESITPQELARDLWHEQTVADGQEQPRDQVQGGCDYKDGAQPDWDRDNAQLYSEPTWNDDGASGAQGGWGHDQVQSPASNSSEYELPPGFLYKVKAIHEYAATDGDELELTIGDLVLVLAIDNPDEQDDGWLMGVQESVWIRTKDISSKGVFPENFTQKV